MRILLSFALLFLASCRTDTPPPTTNCVNDGFGGADCRFDGEQIVGCVEDAVKKHPYYYCPPSAMKNFISKPPGDMGRFVAWCYDVKVSEVTPEILKQISQIKREEFHPETAKIDWGQ